MFSNAASIAESGYSLHDNYIDTRVWDKPATLRPAPTHFIEYEEWKQVFALPTSLLSPPERDRYETKSIEIGSRVFNETVLRPRLGRIGRIPYYKAPQRSMLLFDARRGHNRDQRDLD